MKIHANSETMSKQEIKLGILLWHRISRFYNQNLKNTNQQLDKWGLTTAQFDLLTNIGVYEPISQQALADKLLVTKGNITQLLKKLELLELIKRERDWKTNYISLTEKGKQLYNQVVPEQQLFQAEQYNKLTIEERKQLLTLLKKLQS